MNSVKIILALLWIVFKYCIIPITSLLVIGVDEDLFPTFSRLKALHGFRCFCQSLTSAISGNISFFLINNVSITCSYINTKLCLSLAWNHWGKTQLNSKPGMKFSLSWTMTPQRNWVMGTRSVICVKLLFLPKKQEKHFLLLAFLGCFLTLLAFFHRGSLSYLLFSVYDNNL